MVVLDAGATIDAVQRIRAANRSAGESVAVHQCKYLILRRRNSSFGGAAILRKGDLNRTFQVNGDLLHFG